MNVLALDCSAKTGWALRDGKGRLIESGVQDFSKARGETNGLVFLRFRNWLAKLINFRPMQGGLLLVYERAHMRGGAASELCIGMQTRVQEAAAELKIESLPVHSTTLKKWATGSGRAGKITSHSSVLKYAHGLAPSINNPSCCLEKHHQCFAFWTAETPRSRRLYGLFLCSTLRAHVCVSVVKSNRVATWVKYDSTPCETPPQQV